MHHYQTIAHAPSACCDARPLGHAAAHGRWSSSNRRR